MKLHMKGIKDARIPKIPCNAKIPYRMITDGHNSLSDMNRWVIRCRLVQTNPEAFVSGQRIIGFTCRTNRVHSGVYSNTISAWFLTMHMEYTSTKASHMHTPAWALFMF